jgi:glycosyltransferase involved in cell wall biosynthesis
MNAPGGEAPLTVCALVPYPAGMVPGQRFRIEQWRPHLAERGIAVDLLPFASPRLIELLYQPGHLLPKGGGLVAGLARRTRQVLAARHYDVLFVYRSLYLVGPSLLEGMSALASRPVVFDFDDAIHMLHTSAANQRFGWLKFPGKTAKLCRLSRHVVVGNEYLADYARTLNTRVTVVPSSVDLAAYRPRPRPPSNGAVVIGWMGSATSQAYLEMFAPVLRQLSQPGLELRVVSDRPPVLPGVTFTWHRWAAASEAAELAEFDIGIMPMPDDPWSRGKCAMKALQYMGMEVPALCSDVGANRDVIRHGENGMLALTEEDWIRSVNELVRAPELRRRLGAAGRATVEARYSAQVCASLFAGVLREAAESVPVGERKPTCPVQ